MKTLIWTTASGKLMKKTVANETALSALIDRVLRAGGMVQSYEHDPIKADKDFAHLKTIGA